MKPLQIKNTGHVCVMDNCAFKKKKKKKEIFCASVLLILINFKDKKKTLNIELE